MIIKQYRYSLAQGEDGRALIDAAGFKDAG
jgi:hypothetical protein